VWRLPNKSGEVAALPAAKLLLDSLTPVSPQTDGGDQDHILLKRAAGGDVGAFEDFYRRNFDAVRAFVLCRARAAASVDDLIQETFARVWQYRTRYVGNSSGRTYVIGVAKNVIREVRRRGDRSYDRRQAAPAPQAHQSDLSEPEDAAALTDLRRLIAQARQSLSPKQQQAIELIYILEIPGPEAAERAQCSYEAFRRRLCLAKKVLKRAVKRLRGRGEE
jgi:RNA polymerase sigma-70 factor (ECF subfamily)